MAKILKVITHSEDETVALASKLVSFLRPGDIMVLTGKLGSGKTVFVRGLAQALGIDENLVNSPSFTIVNEYPGERPLYHFDLYRLEDPDELYEIGWDEYLSRSGLIVVEWGEKAGEFLTDRYYRIDFRIVNESQREIEISAVGS